MNFGRRKEATPPWVHSAPTASILSFRAVAAAAIVSLTKGTILFRSALRPGVKPDVSSLGVVN